MRRARSSRTTTAPLLRAPCLLLAPTLVPRLLEQLQRERDGQPLTSRRLVVFVFNGHNHYDATVPQ